MVTVKQELGMNLRIERDWESMVMMCLSIRRVIFQEMKKTQYIIV